VDFLECFNSTQKVIRFFIHINKCFSYRKSALLTLGYCARMAVEEAEEKAGGKHFSLSSLLCAFFALFLPSPVTVEFVFYTQHIECDTDNIAMGRRRENLRNDLNLLCSKIGKIGKILLRSLFSVPFASRCYFFCVFDRMWRGE
jgi:hypothetical protein